MRSHDCVSTQITKLIVLAEFYKIFFTESSADFGLIWSMRCLAASEWFQCADLDPEDELVISFPPFEFVYQELLVYGCWAQTPTHCFLAQALGVALNIQTLSLCGGWSRGDWEWFETQTKKTKHKIQSGRNHMAA